MPSVLYDYAELVKRGDRYTRTANLHRRAVRRDSNGQTASQRFRIKAERCYESAVMLLCNTLESDASRNPLYDPALAAQVQQWLDRDVDARDGFQPEITAEVCHACVGEKANNHKMQIVQLLGKGCVSTGGSVLHLLMLHLIYFTKKKGVSDMQGRNLAEATRSFSILFVVLFAIFGAFGKITFTNYFLPLLTVGALLISMQMPLELTKYKGGDDEQMFAKKDLLANTWFTRIICIWLGTAVALIFVYAV